MRLWKKWTLEGSDPSLSSCQEERGQTEMWWEVPIRQATTVDKRSWHPPIVGVDPGISCLQCWCDRWHDCHARGKTKYLPSNLSFQLCCRNLAIRIASVNCKHDPTSDTMVISMPLLVYYNITNEYASNWSYHWNLPIIFKRMAMRNELCIFSSCTL